MENSNKDKITREILGNSKLELKNPDFNNIVMNKIISEAHKPKILYNSAFYLTIFLLLDVLIFILFELFKITLIEYSPDTGSLINELVMSLRALNDLVFENIIIQYTVVASMFLIILSKMASFGVKYSK